MRIRTLLVIVLVSAGFTLAATPAAAKTPRCYGKAATQWLTEPGELVGTTGNDVLVGSNGADIFDLRFSGEFGGIDIVCGGGGDDTIYIAGEPGSKANGGNGSDTVYAYGTAVARGGPGDDAIVSAIGTGGFAYGDSGDDHVVASFGADADGGSGNDHVENDSTAGRIGHIYGGSGNDLLRNVNAVDAYFDCGPGADSVEANGATHVRRCEIDS